MNVTRITVWEEYEHGCTVDSTSVYLKDVLEDAAGIQARGWEQLRPQLLPGFPAELLDQREGNHTIMPPPRIFNALHPPPVSLNVNHRHQLQVCPAVGL